MQRINEERIEFKKIKGFENYVINENGEVISLLSNNKIMKPSFNKSLGYYMITLRKNKKPYKKYIHRLVAENFLEKPYDKNIVNHRDGNKINNHYSNLEWCTSKENNKHARIFKLNNQIGEKHSSSKLKDYEIKTIISLYSSGRFTQEDLSNIFDVHQVQISRIINYKRRKTANEE